MRYPKFSLLILLLLFTVACTNFSKIYNSGSITSSNYYSEVIYETRLDLIILPVQIRGETYQFLFDTGAPNVISNELSEILQVKASASGNVRDSQGKRDKLEVLKIDSIGIGGVYFYNTAAVVADLNQSEIACLEIDGILGANLMRYAYWKIDSENKVLVLSSNLDTLTSGMEECYSLPFKSQRTYTPLVSMVLNDSLIESITYDTGSGGYLTFGKDLDLTPELFIAEYTGYGSAGLFGSQRDTLRYGSIEVEVDGFRQKGIASYNTGNSKLLGMEFLGQFVQVLDWQKNEIALYENKVAAQVFDRFPVTPRMVDGKMIVGGLMSDLDSGLSIGDTIAYINGMSFQEADFADYCELLLKSRTDISDTLSLELSSGKKHEFTRVNLAIE